MDGIRDGHFVFWASSIYAMNDPSEFLYGYDVLMKKIQEYEDNNQIEKQYQLSTIWDNPPIGVDNKEQHLLNALEELNDVPYILSFSHEGDSLPMWNMYGGNGHGINLCFRSAIPHVKEGIDFFKPTIDDIVITDSLRTYDVSYGHFPDNKVSIFNKMYKELTMGIKGLNKKELFDKKITSIATFLVVFGAMIKDKAYEYESEARFIERQQDLSKVKFRTSTNGHIIAYIEKGIPLTNLRSITIGPCSDYSTVRMFIKAELSKHLPDNIQIEKSSVPYRIY